jgi:hypothetical protein
MMTAATVSHSLSPALTRRERVRWTDLAWLVWRQHRLLIVVTTIGVAIASALYWWDATDVVHSNAYQVLANVIVPAASGLVGVFWGAPLLASEYEQRTHLVAWAQDTSPVRWMIAKFVLLGAVIAVLWAILGAADSTFIHVVNGNGPMYSSLFGRWGMAGFESWIPLQVIYALFGFALGVAVSALVRRTVMAIGLTAVLFAGVRFAVLDWRPTFLPPLIAVLPPRGPTYSIDTGPGALQIGFGQTVDAAGNPISIPFDCYNIHTSTWSVPCATAHGAVATYQDYQPASRLLPFHLIEFGIFAVLTAALIAFTVYRLRANRVAA